MASELVITAAMESRCTWKLTKSRASARALVLGPVECAAALAPLREVVYLAHGLRGSMGPDRAIFSLLTRAFMARGRGNFLDQAGAAVDNAVGWVNGLVTGSRQRGEGRQRPRHAQDSGARDWWQQPEGMRQAQAAPHAPVRLASDQVRREIWRLPMEEYATTEELRAWPVSTPGLPQAQARQG